ncbi:unnamed protein product [Periconia digitata]|uniref:Uncharacterized protein n=1 Tax=Periconia digitata TaxID=1303443 RepID=A0A9W4UKL6_9PLEO|nr:unnamed protein product [Periconia digitata]
MSSIIGRTAFRAAPRLRPTPVARRWATSTAGTEERKAGKDALKQGAKRDPELYVLLAIMSGIFGIAGWHFSRSPTSASSERTVAQAANSKPWEAGGGEGKYQYHPGGDPNAPKKDAPSALNSVIIPNVTLPKVCPYVSRLCSSETDCSLGTPRPVQQVGQRRLLDTFLDSKTFPCLASIRQTHPPITHHTHHIFLCSVNKLKLRLYRVDTNGNSSEIKRTEKSLKEAITVQFYLFFEILSLIIPNHLRYFHQFASTFLCR